MFWLLFCSGLLATGQMPNQVAPGPVQQDKVTQLAPAQKTEQKSNPATTSKADQKSPSNTEKSTEAKADQVPAAAPSVPEVLVVVGAPGTPEYEKRFKSWAQEWEKAATKGGAKVTLIGLTEPEGKNVKEQLRQLLENATGESPLWIVLIGHGTDDGKECRFNLLGPDASAAEMKAWLEKLKRPIAFFHCGSSSAPFLKALSAPGRVVITATRSGSESNYSRFGQFLAQALNESRADLDLDGQVSILEAFLFASAGVAEYYKAEGRLATEHALIDDNGDGLGSQADWFQGIRAVKRAKDGAQVDGQRAHQWHLTPSPREQGLSAERRKKRDGLELKLFQWRDQKARMSEEEYYKGLEAILVELGAIYLDRPAAPQARIP